MSDAAGTPSPLCRRRIIATVNWRRLTVNGSYSYINAKRNALGPFDVPASGSLSTEWGNGPADNPYRVSVGLTSTQVRNLSANFAISASDGYLFSETTGFDDNHYGLLNDRPAGVGIWQLRSPRIWTVSGRFTYNLPMGATVTQPGPPQRYRASVYVSINNLTNHANLSGFSGVVTSPFFMKANNVQNPRKMDMGMNISF